MNKSQLLKSLNHLSLNQNGSTKRKTRILIIGDIILDKYFIGEIMRISPEAPVPVVKYKHMTYNLGGAGNVAFNVANLGIDILLVGVVGKDDDAKILRELMHKESINCYLVEDQKCPTISKTRVICQKQQICRLDIEEKGIESNKFQNIVKDNVLSLINEFDLVIISDYDKGFLQKDILRSIIDISNYYSIPIIIDPKKKDFSIYHGATFLTPNEKEFFHAIGKEITEDLEIVKKEANVLLKNNDFKALLITRGSKGIFWVEPEYSINVPTTVKEVFDVAGAGDTVIAVFSYAITNGFSIEESINLANKAAGIVINSFGVNPIKYNELFGNTPLANSQELNSNSKSKDVIFENL